MESGPSETGAGWALDSVYLQVLPNASGVPKISMPSRLNAERYWVVRWCPFEAKVGQA